MKTLSIQTDTVQLELTKVEMNALAAMVEVGQRTLIWQSSGNKAHYSGIDATATKFRNVLGSQN